MTKSKIPLIALALLGGCSLAPDYKRPAAPVAESYPSLGSAETAGVSPSDLAWRDFFQDERLRGLIDTALENNRDLRVAALRVQRMQSLYDIQRNALIPSLDASASGTRQRTPGSLSSSGNTVTSSSYSVGLKVPSYELDFFGRVVSLRDQVLQEYLATEEAQKSAQISIVSAVARQYLSLLAVEEQLELTRQTLAAAEQSFELNQQTFEAGVSSELDLSAAEAQRASVQASLAAAEQSRALALNALSELVGSPLSSDVTSGASLAKQDFIADLPAGLPSDLLNKRPDILAAEHALQAANANIGVARAAFFPSVKLTAFGGSASPDLDGLFGSDSGSWSFAPSITLPIFSSGVNTARFEVAKVDREISLANYEKAIQTAFREVADALAIRSSIDAQIEAQATRVSATQRRYDLSKQRFEAGVDSFVSVLLAQQELFSAQRSYIQARLARVTNLTGLYAALGGGW